MVLCKMIENPEIPQLWESKYNLLIGPKYSSQHCYSLSLELDHLALYITLLVVSINTAVEIYIDLTLP